MKKTFYLLILLLVFVFSACTLHIPYDSYENYSSVRVVLHIEPDDAEVLLNGRLIGEAFEFSTPDSALRLSSRKNDLIIKKGGYIEELINLYDYSSRNITVRLALRKDKGFVREIPKEKERVSLQPIPKTVKEIEPPEKPGAEEKIGKFKLIKIILEIEPEESSIYLNGKFWGISPKRGKIENLRLKPGKYTLQIVKPGYKEYRKEMVLTDQKEIRLSIKLIK
ncbi:MAG: PEGA domain-containing protein [Candidatus Aminicenantes bacterium]|nr:PEGA domain-containing protein [Candidatus Aminicenantes bacterium]